MGRSDRRQHVLAVVGQQDQVDERGRLLERLEQPVGGLVVHRSGPFDHEHPARGLKRRAGGGRDDRLVDVADEQF
jgi:hypothetical protein